MPTPMIQGLGELLAPWHFLDNTEAGGNSRLANETTRACFSSKVNDEMPCQKQGNTLKQLCYHPGKHREGGEEVNALKPGFALHLVGIRWLARQSLG